MDFDVRKQGRVNIVDMSGRLTIGQGDLPLRGKVVDLLDVGERLFVFNMLKVAYIDSAGLGETVACKKRIGEQQGFAKLVLSDEKMLRLFTITGLDRVFEIFDTEDEAIASFGEVAVNEVAEPVTEEVPASSES